MAAGSRIEVCQWLVEEQHLHIIDQDTGERDALLLATGEVGRALGEEGGHIDHRGHLAHTAVHLGLPGALILQAEGDILPYREGDELGIGILHHRTYQLVHLIDGTGAHL